MSLTLTRQKSGKPAPLRKARQRTVSTGLMTPLGAEAQERMEFARLKLLSRSARTPDDIRALKRAVAAWVSAAPGSKLRKRRLRWAQAIRGAFAHFEGDAP